MLSLGQALRSTQLCRSGPPPVGRRSRLPRRASPAPACPISRASWRKRREAPIDQADGGGPAEWHHLDGGQPAAVDCSAPVPDPRPPRQDAYVTWPYAPPPVSAQAPPDGPHRPRRPIITAKPTSRSTPCPERTAPAWRSPWAKPPPSWEHWLPGETDEADE